MYSIYHFFADLHRKRHLFQSVEQLEDFRYDFELLSCSSTGKFPDMAIRVNPTGFPTSGGELIELKDSKSFTVSSFNSTIPTGKKSIETLVSGKTNKIRKQMQEAGDDIFSLPIRDVYYLIRGKKANNIKVCLVHGSFFETIRVEELIRQAFSQVLDERLVETNQVLDLVVQELLLQIFSNQENFSKTRDVANASVKLRFRIMTEVKQEGNILNSKRYPEISNNTLNLLIPFHSSQDAEIIKKKIASAVGQTELSDSRQLSLKHPLNGSFYVLQFPI